MSTVNYGYFVVTREGCVIRTAPPIEPETCSEHEDGQHCNCWYDAEPCCACGAQ